MALPITISGGSFVAPNGGPFKSGTSFYLVAASGATQNVEVFKADSDDPSSGWTIQDGTNNPTGSTFASMHSVLSGTTIHIVTQEASAAGTDVEYHTFNCSTNTWAITNESVTTAPDGGVAFCSISVRSDGDVIIAYQGAEESNMGTGYDRIDLARRESGSWTADISVDNLGKTTTHMRYPFVVMSANDRAHIFYSDVTDSDLHYSTYLSGNTWGHQHTEVDTAISSNPNIRAVRFDDGGVEKIRALYSDTGINVNIVGFNDADNPGASISIATDITGTHSAQDQRYPAFAVDDATDTQYALTADSNATSAIDESETGSGDDTWSTNADELTGISSPAHIYSANVYSNGGTVLAYLYQDGGNYRYNERSLASGALTLTADAASATIAGQTVDLEQGYLVTAAAGGMTVAAAAVNLAKGKMLAADAGTLTVDGQATTLARGYPLVADAGAVTIDAQTADLLSPGEWDNTEFRWRDDDDDEVNATWLAAVNTNGLSLGFDKNIRIRFGVSETSGTVNTGEKNRFRLMYREDGGSWLAVSARGNKARPVALEDSPNLLDTGAATQQITAGTYIDGLYVTQFNTTAANQNDSVANGDWEVEWCIRFTSDSDFPAFSGQVFDFRMQIDPQNGTNFVDLDAYSQTPSITFENVIYSDAGTVTIDAQATSLEQGYLVSADNGTLTVDAQAATLSKGQTLSADAGTLTIDGQTVGFLYGYSVEAAFGTITIGAQAADLLQGYEVAADAAALTIDGQATDFLFGYSVDSAAGALTVGAQDVAVLYGQSVEASAATITIAAQAVALEHGYVISAAAGAITTAAQDVTLNYSGSNPVLTADAGSITIAGQAVSLEQGYLVSAEVAAVTVAGQAVALSKGHPLAAEAGTLDIDGQAAELLVGHLVEAGTASLSITAQTAGLLHGREVAANVATLDINAQVSETLVGRLVAAEIATVTVNGQATNLLQGYTLASEAASVTIAAQNAALVYGTANTLNAEAASMTIAAEPANLNYVEVADERQRGASWFPSGYYTRPNRKPAKEEVDEAIARVVEIAEQNDYRISPRQLTRMVNAMVRREDAPTGNIEAVRARIDAVESAIEQAEQRKVIEREAAELAFLLAHRDAMNAVDDEEALFLLASI